jgi:hypothetical protein
VDTTGDIVPEKGRGTRERRVKGLCVCERERESDGDREPEKVTEWGSADGDAQPTVKEERKQ